MDNVLNMPMRYLIIDRDYRVYQADTFTGRMRKELKDGEISVIDIKRMQGCAIDGLTWETLPPISNYFEVS